ncbi:unnamed protein product, partial [marine sediment metagenome]
FMNRVNKGDKVIGKYDSIVMCAVLEHLKNPVKIIKHLKTHLNPKGRIIMTVPTKAAHIPLKIFSILDSSAPKEHIKEHIYRSFNSIKSMVEECNMKIIHHDYFQLRMNQLIVLEMEEKTTGDIND